MKLKSSFFYTMRDDSKEEDVESAKLLVKSGMVKKSSSGVYMYMPIGLKALNNINSVIREEMDKAGAQELLMPCLLPDEVYKESGRLDTFGNDMFRLKDRADRNYVLGPTHEELFVMAAKEKVKSYKDLPFNLYQIGTKYRDEARPRYGLLRVREFAMKDAYSFDIDQKKSEIAYQKMYNAYNNIFDRLKFDYRIVKADTGAMGGLLSEEYQAICDIGEDTVVLCDKCDFSSNIEVCESVTNEYTKEERKEKELLYTPNCTTVKDLINIAKVTIDKIMKTILYVADGNYYACMVPGKYDVNELKVRKLLNAKEVRLAETEEVKKITNAEVGFAGPIGIDIPIIVDKDVLDMYNYVVGANKTDYHYVNVNITDFKYAIAADIKETKEGDTCPKCGGNLSFKKGIEIGNIFSLGTKYSESLGLYYLDENNERKPVFMGCYGIGPGRTLAALVEQHHDEKGIVWPMEVAPYKVGIVLINNDNVEIANKLYDELTNLKIDTILDDRDERAGVKFNDMDLIGVPIKITIGKKINKGIIEFKTRDGKIDTEYKLDEVINKIKELI